MTRFDRSCCGPRVEGAGEAWHDGTAGKRQTYMKIFSGSWKTWKGIEKRVIHLLLMDGVSYVGTPSEADIFNNRLVTTYVLLLFSILQVNADIDWATSTWTAMPNLQSKKDCH